MIAREGKPKYRNGSASGNENGSFPALRANPHVRFLSSLAFSTLAPPEIAKPSLCFETLYGKVHVVIWYRL